jgi:hypothetical protein
MNYINRVVIIEGFYFAFIFFQVESAEIRLKVDQIKTLKVLESAYSREERENICK